MIDLRVQQTSGDAPMDLPAWLDQLVSHALIPESTPGTDRLARIRVFEQVRSAVAAAQAAEVAALAAERRVTAELEIAAVDVVGVGRHRRREQARRRMVAEVGSARRISPWQAGQFVAFAEQARTDLPETYRLFATGQVSERRALAVWNAVAGLDPEQRRQVDAVLATRLPGWGDREVDRQARAAVYRIDPAGAVARHAYAREHRRVTVRPAPECMAWVSTLTTMPDAVALRAQLERDAAALIAAGDPRTRAQVMSDLVVERVTGRGVADGPVVAVELLITDQTLLGGADPARFADGEPYPAPLARDLALGPPSTSAGPGPGPGSSFGSGSGSGSGSEDTAAARSVRRLFTDPAGRLITGETHSRRFTSAMRDLIRLRDGLCTTPWCDAAIHDIDHIDPHVHGGPTAIVNGRGLCRWCNTTKGADRPPDPPDDAWPGVPTRAATDPPTDPPADPRSEIGRPHRSPVERRLRRHLRRERRRTRRPGVLDECRAHVLVDLPTHRR